MWEAKWAYMLVLNWDEELDLQKGIESWVLDSGDMPTKRETQSEMEWSLCFLEVKGTNADNGLQTFGELNQNTNRLVHSHHTAPCNCNLGW
jgi:hypothetical protein